jgi:hypothetical protein
MVTWACSSNGDHEWKKELLGGGVNVVAAQAWHARGGGRPLNRRLSRARDKG